MEPNISTQVWIIATVFGGVGAAIVQLIIELIKDPLRAKKIRKNLKREIQFNIKQCDQIIDELIKLKEDHIKLDRQTSYWHYFDLKSSAVLFRALINAGVVYDYLNDDQMIKIDNFCSEKCDFLNEQITKIREEKYTKKDAADQADFFIKRYRQFKTELSSVLMGIK